jgi:hypothetical protein
MDQFITVPDLARRWRCSPSIIYALVQARKITCLRIGLGRGCIRFTEAQVREFEEAATIKPDASLPKELRHIRLPS